MSPWVRSEYAAELAVLSAWLSALVPWTVTYSGEGPLGSTLVLIRTGVLEVQFVRGLTREIVVNGQAQDLQNLDEILAALAFSLLLYTREESLEAGPVDPVRLMGGLLGAATVAFAASAYFRVNSDVPGVPIPAGLVVVGLLSATLLTVDREPADAKADPEPEPEPDRDPDAGGT